MDADDIETIIIIYIGRKQTHLYPRRFMLSLACIPFIQTMVLQLDKHDYFSLLITKDCTPPIPHVSFSNLSSLPFSSFLFLDRYINYG